MKAVIRVDASRQIGSGHWMRCLTLAERLKKERNAEVHFISRDLEGNLHELAEESGFILHVLPFHEEELFLTGYASWLTVPQSVDIEETKSILMDIGKIDILIVDSYALDISWEKKMRPFVKEIFVIDDLANRRHHCDWLLDQNYYLDKETRYRGLVPTRCKMLLGPMYALLREEFYNAKLCMKHRTGELKRIMIFYGGSDVTGETYKAVRAVSQLGYQDIQVDVVVGKSNIRQEMIREMCDQKFYLQYHEQINNMAELMNCADLMLGAGGTTMWERCFLGLPAIVTAVADNQVKICEDSADAGFIDYVGFYDMVSEVNLMEKIKNLTKKKLKRMSEQCVRVFGN